MRAEFLCDLENPTSSQGKLVWATGLLTMVSRDARAAVVDNAHVSWFVNRCRSRESQENMEEERVKL